MRPFRINIIGECGESLSTLQRYADTCAGLDRIEKQQPHGRKLAVVGGGSSALENLDELKSWDGEIWSINSTGAWLKSHGIDSTFFSVDPGPLGNFNTQGMEKALIATCCHPELRKKFQSVHLFDMYETSKDGMAGGVTSATRAPSVAIHLGYYDITFYGCEGSFDLDKSHVDRHEHSDDLLIIRAGGKEYITRLEMVMQSENLSELIRLAPNVFKSKSGGLLDAMIHYPDTWEIAAVSDHLKNHLQEHNGNSGLYETPYIPEAQCPSI
jgi:hypothetical protein